MFDKLKKAFSREPKAAVAAEAGGAPMSQMFGPVSEWAQTQGFAIGLVGKGGAIALQGRVSERPWRMEIGAPSRKYIRGEELRARAELGINDDVAVLVMNRTLKEALEKQAYAMFTDPLRTTADPNLPEEMRWLSMFEEVGWDSLPMPFWKRYSVLTDRRENALAWVDPNLAELLMDWPDPGPGPEVPFLLLLLRGKGYLRMEYAPAQVPVLQHAALIFTSACDSAVGSFSTDLSL